jgi:hypothetical protein
LKHQEFVKHLNAIGFAPCGSNGCIAHIPCDWLTLENFKAAAERHETWLKQQGVDIDNMLKPAAESEGWCVLWAINGANAGSGTYLLPKYWLGNLAIRDPNAPQILRGYKLAFVFFRYLVGIMLSCRSMYPSPFERLELLRRYLGLVGTQMAPNAQNFSASPVIIASAAQGLPRFEVDDYEGMGAWLHNILQDCEQNFKDFILLAPAFFENPTDK